MYQKHSQNLRGKQRTHRFLFEGCCHALLEAEVDKLTTYRRCCWVNDSDRLDFIVNTYWDPAGLKQKLSGRLGKKLMKMDTDVRNFSTLTWEEKRE